MLYRQRPDKHRGDAQMIQLHMAERLDDLAGALAQHLAVPMADPMAPEVLVVPTSGMQRWLSLELSRHLGTSGLSRSDGVSANIKMQFPGSLTKMLAPEGDDFDPWELERVAWVLLEVLVDRPDVAPPLAPGATAWARARRLADLFDRYMTHRPVMIRNWAAGHDVEGAGRPVNAHARWQPGLWRLVRQRIGRPSPPELMPQRIADLLAGRFPESIPERISLFGLSTIPGGTPLIELLDALGGRREVHVFMHQPSLAMVGQVAGAQSAAANAPHITSTPHIRAEDQSSSLVANPLLCSWGRPAREAIVLLGDRCADTPSAPGPPPTTSVTLLAQLQSNLRGDTPPAGTFEYRDDDRSITIHSCYGDRRQVEVLRDQILHLLVDDPTLDEDDIVVFCPALDTFAPIIESVLGPPGDPLHDPSGPEVRHRVQMGAPSLRYRLSDRSLRSSYPLLGALGALVELLASRFSDRAVLEFASLDAVRRRHGFDDDALRTLAGWIATANTRWGIDGRHREWWGIPAGHEAGSWRRGIDRLLMGIAVSEDNSALAPGGLLPIGVEGTESLVVGRLAAMLDRLARLTAQADEPRPPHDWIELLRCASGDLFAPDPDHPWELQRLNAVFERIDDAATVIDRTGPATDDPDRHPSEVDLTLQDLRHLIGTHLGASAGRPDFFRGGITFSTPTPLRAIPYRVICLLGMDDSAFSSGPLDGDDLVAAEPHLGDRDRRADTRHVLLDCVLAANENLVVMRNGHNVVTNQEVPAAVPLAELTDVLAATVRPRQRDHMLERLTVEHPRQRFDEANFHAEERPLHEPRPPSRQMGLDRPWSFDPSDCTGATARRAKSTARQFMGDPLAPVHPQLISIDDLREFLVHPPRFFLRHVLELSLPKPPSRDDASTGTTPTGSSGLPAAAEGRNLLIELDGLEAWRIRQDLLDHRRAGGDLDSFRAVMTASDKLPPEPLAEVVISGASQCVEPVMEIVEELCDPSAKPEHIPIDLQLDSGVRLIGTVRNDRGLTPGPLRFDMSSLKPKLLLVSWLDALVLSAAQPEQQWQAVHVAGGNPADPRPRVRTFSTTTFNTTRFNTTGEDPGPHDDPLHPMDALEVVVDLFLRGHREPLPLFPTVSHALYSRPGTAPGAWSKHGGGGDGDDEWIRVAFDDAGFETITSLAVSEDDPDAYGTDRATLYANHLWGTVQHSSPGTELKL